MAELYIVRHAQVNIDFSVPSAGWHISEDGIRATRELVLSENWSGVILAPKSTQTEGMG
ncbi:hypothetical protein ACOJUR_10665 [Alicyclobacillus tolerans]|uniref:hypothetical protein n=1 Tax=Alicyclobacillus tolerans TaxID=90970 RepID=UPI003B780200